MNRIPGASIPTVIALNWGDFMMAGGNLLSISLSRAFVGFSSWEARDQSSTDVQIIPGRRFLELLLGLADKSLWYNFHIALHLGSVTTKAGTPSAAEVIGFCRVPYSQACRGTSSRRSQINTNSFKEETRSGARGIVVWKLRTSTAKSWHAVMVWQRRGFGITPGETAGSQSLM